MKKNQGMRLKLSSAPLKKLKPKLEKKIGKKKPALVVFIILWHQSIYKKVILEQNLKITFLSIFIGFKLFCHSTWTDRAEIFLEAVWGNAPKLYYYFSTRLHILIPSKIRQNYYLSQGGKRVKRFVRKISRAR